MPSIIKVICILSLFSLMLCQSETIVSSATEIKVCFTGTHSSVFDLGFYLIGPPSCNSPTITFVTYNPSITIDGHDFNNFCFSTSAMYNFDFLEVQTPLTGTYGSVNGVSIDWSGLYGCNSATSGWRLQIYDCTLVDEGSLTGGTLQFKLNGQTILYESGAINLPINDDTCSPDIALVFEFQTDQINCVIEFCTACENSMCLTCNDDANGNVQIPSIDGSACVLDCSVIQDCIECTANPNTICTNCGQDANGNTQISSIDGSACVLDCSVIQDCIECTANPNTICTNCGQDANGNTQISSIDGSSCVLDCSVIQDCIECTANPNTICTKCAQDSFDNPQVPNNDGSSCVSPCKIHNCIACKFQGTLFEKCSQCSSDSNGNLLVPAPSGKICIKDRFSAKQCHQSCQKCVGTWNFCSRCKPGLKWVLGGTCTNY